MKTPRPCIALAAILLSFAGCAQRQRTGEEEIARTPPPAPEATWDFNRIAVIPSEESKHALHGDAGLLASIEDDFAELLISKGYLLCERSQLAKVLEERQVTDTLGKEESRALSELLGVDGLLVVRVTKVSHPDRVKAPKPASKAWDVIPGFPGITINGNSRNRGGSTSQDDEYVYEVTAGVSARLIRAEDGVVLWVKQAEQRKQAETPERAREALRDASRIVAAQFPTARQRPVQTPVALR